MPSKQDRVMPPLPKGFNSPFWYASLYSFKTFHKVPTARLKPFLKGTGLKVANFVEDGVLRPDFGYVTLEYQSYTAMFGTGNSSTNEVELNIVVYPEADDALVPELTLAEYLAGFEQEKRIGGFHVCVPADNPVAVSAGIAFFGEPKFFAPFVANVPSPNNPGVTQWNYTVCDPEYKPPSAPGGPPPPPNMVIYQLLGDLGASVPQLGDPSSHILYGMLPGGKIVGDQGYTGTLIANRWDVFSGYQSYFLNEDQQLNIHLNYGQSDHPMVGILRQLLGAAPAPCVAVQTYQTPPCAAESRAYFIQPQPGGPSTAAPKPSAASKKPAAPKKPVTKAGK